MSIIDQIDECLHRYYKKKGRNDYVNDTQIGKFKEYCDENGFDDEFVEEEFAENEDDCQLVDFDDNFPFDSKPVDSESKNLFIYKIVCECYRDIDAFTDDSLFYTPIDVTPEDWNNMTESDIQQTKEELKNQVSTIYNTEMEQDNNILKVLAIGRKLDAPYLQYLTDLYLRDRILRKDENLNVTKWATMNRYMIRLNNEQSGYGKSVYETVKTSIESFFHRICPNLMLQPTTMIHDKLETISEYILAMVNFTHNLAKENNESCPFQVDNCIIFDKVTSNHNMEMKGLEANDDDDDDDDDDIPHHDHLTIDDDGFFDCIGDIKKKLEAENLLYFNTTFDDTNYGVGIPSSSELTTKGATTSRFPHQFNEFKNTKLSKKYKGSEFMQYPRNKRFITVVDRREKDENRPFLTDDDELIFFEPPDICNSIPKPKHVGLWYFDSSRCCIIPNIGFSNGKYADDADHDDIKDYENDDIGTSKLLKQNITSIANVKGALMCFSFHVNSADSIKCYMYLNGTVTRFFPSDIINLLPLFFSPDFADNKHFAQSKEAQTLIEHMTPKLRDYAFESFYNEYKIR